MFCAIAAMETRHVPKAQLPLPWEAPRAQFGTTLLGMSIYVLACLKASAQVPQYWALLEVCARTVFKRVTLNLSMTFEGMLLLTTS